jgi:hypothetical protein
VTIFEAVVASAAVSAEHCLAVELRRLPRSHFFFVQPVNDCAFRLLRQLNKPKLPSPLERRGSAAGITRK